MPGARSIPICWALRRCRPSGARAELAIPAERFGKPEEIAAMAAFLMGPDADFITGQGIGINGGSVMP